MQSFAVARLLCLKHKPEGQGKEETVQIGSELLPRQWGCAGHWSHCIARHSWAMPRSVVHRPCREDACQGINSQAHTKGRRATNPNLSQTTTAAVVTARGYSCKPDLHRRKKQPRQCDIKRDDKTWRKFTLVQKKFKEGTEVSYLATVLETFTRTPHALNSH